MRPLLSPDEMAAADAAAISDGTPAEVLMDRAGRALAREVLRVAGRRYGLRVALVCGKGNNGGDGFAAARVLLREGVSARCLVIGHLESVEGAARQHLARLRQESGEVSRFDPALLRESDVVVDALFGTGFRGVAEGEAAAAIEAMNAHSRVVAADIPSGVDGATGASPGPAVSAVATVAMAAEKTGTAVGRGASLAGEVTVADIGIPVADASAFVIEGRDVAQALPRRAPDAHKRSDGAVAILAGSDAMTGAAVLAATGALRAGAGYVTVGSTRATTEALQAMIPEVLASIVADSPHLGVEALDHFADVMAKADSLVLGPGIGRGDAQRALVDRLLAETVLPIVLDADGLNVLQDHQENLVRRKAPTVITPHPAELARLLETDTQEIQSDRMSSARWASEKLGCVVLLKGFRTIIARPGGPSVVNGTGGPELATAGTGDVLTGAVASLLAAGLDAFSAAWAAAYVHGVAGSLAAEQLGSSGVLAGDVAEMLPEARLSLRDG